MEKFPDSARLIAQELPEVEILEPEWVDRSVLELVHTPDYLRRMEHGLTAPEEQRLGLPWSKPLLRRCWLETSSTVRAAEAALEHGVACNLGGGTHHAFPSQGLGYCVLNDVAVAIHYLQKTTTIQRYMVIDTDAHQGNGTAAIFPDDPFVYTYSIHGGRNYPSEKPPSTLDVPLPRQVSGHDYLAALRETLPAAIRKFQPNLIFWNSGADVHEDDLFGQMGLSTDHMRLRDEAVVRWAREGNAALVALYGGGYNKQPGMTTRLHANTVGTVFRMA
jgi:acetoin utilization deacetylase AcuC-like enzyme